MEIQAALVLFVLVASITPGPNNIMMLASGLNHGVRASIPHMLGIVFGFAALLLSVGFGFGFLFERYIWLHQVIQIVGICYLIYLSYLIANTNTHVDIDAGENDAEQVSSKPFTFLQAALFQWVNPKAWVMGTSAIATYSTVGSDSVLQILGIVSVFMVFTLPAILVWLIFGVALQKLLSNDDYRQWFNVCMGLLLFASVVPSIYGLVFNSI